METSGSCYWSLIGVRHQKLRDRRFHKELTDLGFQRYHGLGLHPKTMSYLTNATHARARATQDSSRMLLRDTDRLSRFVCSSDENMPLVMSVCRCSHGERVHRVQTSPQSVWHVLVSCNGLRNTWLHQVRSRTEKTATSANRFLGGKRKPMKNEFTPRQCRQKETLQCGNDVLHITPTPLCNQIVTLPPGTQKNTTFSTQYQCTGWV